MRRVRRRTRRDSLIRSRRSDLIPAFSSGIFLNQGLTCWLLVSVQQFKQISGWTFEGRGFWSSSHPQVSFSSHIFHCKILILWQLFSILLLFSKRRRAPSWFPYSLFSWEPNCSTREWGAREGRKGGREGRGKGRRVRRAGQIKGVERYAVRPPEGMMSGPAKTRGREKECEERGRRRMVKGRDEEVIGITIEWKRIGGIFAFIQNLRIVVPHVGLVLLSAAYTILGAAIFHHVCRLPIFLIVNDLSGRWGSVRNGASNIPTSDHTLDRW